MSKHTARVRWLRAMMCLAAVATAQSAEATCIELESYGCEIIPTFGDCSSPTENVWAPDTLFTYRIGCEPRSGQTADLALKDGTILKAKPEPLRQCEQWSLWVLEEPLPGAGGEGLTLQAHGTDKPLYTNLTIVADAAKAARSQREPRKDFVCNVARPDPRRVLARPQAPSGCASCSVGSAPENGAVDSASLSLLALVWAWRRRRAGSRVARTGRSAEVRAELSR